MSQRPNQLQYNPDASNIEYIINGNVFPCSIGTGGAIWGAITGALGNQTDLATALALLAPLTSPTFVTGMTLTSPFVIKPNTGAVNGISFVEGDGTTTIFSINTLQGRVGVGTSTPSALFEVAGNGNFFGTVDAQSGLLLPQFSTATIGTLPTTKGYTVYNTDTDQMEVADGSAFEPVGGGSPGGSDSQIQFNGSGVFAGSANLLFTDNPATIKMDQGSATDTGISFLDSGTPVANITSSADGGDDSLAQILEISVQGQSANPGENIIELQTGSGTGIWITDDLNSQQYLAMNGLQATDPSAILDVNSLNHNLGVLLPRMSTTQKNAIASPAEGLIVYDLTLHALCVYNGSAWKTITAI